jgi:hypothetical protein
MDIVRPDVCRGSKHLTGADNKQPPGRHLLASHGLLECAGNIRYLCFSPRYYQPTYTMLANVIGAICIGSMTQSGLPPDFELTAPREEL